MDDTNDNIPTSISLTGEGVSEGRKYDTGPDGPGIFEIMSEDRAVSKREEEAGGKRIQLKLALASVIDGEAGPTFTYYMNLPARITDDGSVKEDAEWAAQWAGFARALHTDVPERPRYDKTTKKNYLGDQELNKSVAAELKAAADKAARKAINEHFNNPGIGVGMRFRATKKTNDRGYTELAYFERV